MGKVVSSINDLTLPPGEYVLALPGWYPSWVDPMPGDFNQRHVKAASLYTPQLVLYIAKDTSNTIKKTEVQYHQLNERVAEIIILYPQEKWKAWDVIQSHATYVKLLYHFANIIKQKWGLPKVLHCYIVLRGGLSGWLLSKQWKLPYLLTENWTIYYPADPGYLRNRNIVFRTLVKKILNNATLFLPVTKNLERQVLQLQGRIPSAVIPNVVDTSIFFYDELQVKNKPFTFVHVSTMTYQKNPEGLFRAYKKFSDKFPGSLLVMVGPYPEEVLSYCRYLGLRESAVSFVGSVSYQQVAPQLQQADALVLFSRYENLPCVILEALCCGVPVISTEVGGIAEVINETNGLLVASEDETMLMLAFAKMMNEYNRFNRKKIAETSSGCFSYETVGKQISEVYKRVVED